MMASQLGKRKRHRSSSSSSSSLSASSSSSSLSASSSSSSSLSHLSFSALDGQRGGSSTLSRGAGYWLRSSSNRSRRDGHIPNLTISTVVNHGQINEAIAATSSYTPEAMATLLIAIKERLHPFLDHETAFKIPLCSRSMVPLASGHAVFRDVTARLQRDGKVRFDNVGVFMNKMGMAVKQVFIEAEDDEEEDEEDDEKQDEVEVSLAVGVLPASLHSLTFGCYFNQPLAAGVLPASLHSLTFGLYSHFNQPGVLPASLHSLTFGEKSQFNQPLAAGVLPAALHTLSFDYDCRFDQPLAAGVLPASLHTLIIDSYFNQPFAVGVIPANLQLLTLMNDRYQHALTTEILPPQLHHMVRRVIG